MKKPTRNRERARRAGPRSVATEQTAISIHTMARIRQVRHQGCKKGTSLSFCYIHQGRSRAEECTTQRDRENAPAHTQKLQRPALSGAYSLIPLPPICVCVYLTNCPLPVCASPWVWSYSRETPALEEPPPWRNPLFRYVIALNS